MSFDGSGEENEMDVEFLFEQEQEIESTEDPPEEEWSSLLCFRSAPSFNKKKILYEEGLYEPPSSEICTRYIPLSDSSILRHPYYPYPAVEDPGIEDALLGEAPKIVYPDDGQELYLALCDEMGECPVSLFHKHLLDSEINLSYYSVSPYGFRPMAMALKSNRKVQTVNLTDNFISDDGCYHFGEMLKHNFTITEMNFSGCRMGPSGLIRLVANLTSNIALFKLNLSKNQLTDVGAEYLARIIYKGSRIRELNLSYNGFTSKTATLLAEGIEFNNRITHLDLSWNSLLVPRPMELLIAQLVESDKILEVNLSWNALSNRFAKALANLLLPPNIQSIDLNNNNLSDNAIAGIAENLQHAKKLCFLNLSYNPLNIADAQLLLKTMRLRRVKLKTLLLDGVTVDENFVTDRNKVLNLKFRKDAHITHGYVTPKFVSRGVDARELVLTRAQAVCNKPKKKRVDIGVMILELHKMFKNAPIQNANELPRLVKMMGAFQMNEDLVEALGAAFPGPKRGKFKTVNLEDMADYVGRKWPEAKLPPTPPPLPPPVAPAAKDAKGKPGAKKGKK